MSNSKGLSLVQHSRNYQKWKPFNVSINTFDVISALYFCHVYIQSCNVVLKTSRISIEKSKKSAIGLDWLTTMLCTVIYNCYQMVSKFAFPNVTNRALVKTGGHWGGFSKTTFFANPIIPWWITNKWTQLNLIISPKQCNCLKSAKLI